MIKRRLRRLLPDPQRVHRHRTLRWLGPALHHPQLWHVSRRGIASGAALGVFFGLLIPVAQIPLAAAFAVLLRANVPTAVASTLVTNPLTFAPLYYLAYRIGALLVGGAPGEQIAESLAHEGEGIAGWLDIWSERLRRLGKPLLVGLPIVAVTLSLLAYVAVDRLWRVATLWAWRRRKSRPAGR